MRTVRITHSNWVNDWLAGDDGDMRLLTDQQAYEAVELHHLAVYTDNGPELVSSPQAVPVVKIEPGLEFPEEPRAADIPEDSGEQPTAEMKMPWSNASKAAWIDWAAHQGADPEQAAALTKNELMSRYGERL